MSGAMQELLAHAAVLVAAGWILAQRLRRRAKAKAEGGCDGCGSASVLARGSARGLRPRSLRVLP